MRHVAQETVGPEHSRRRRRLQLLGLGAGTTLILVGLFWGPWGALLESSGLIGVMWVLFIAGVFAAGIRRGLSRSKR